MWLRRVVAVLVCCVCLATWTRAVDIHSVAMISLADNGNPWTVTVVATGQVEWKQSSSGFLLDSFLGEEEGIPRKITGAREEDIAALFALVTAAGYTQELDHGQEPKIKLLVMLADGTEIFNSGPNEFVEEDSIRAFRDIEQAIVGLVGYDYAVEVKKYIDGFSESGIFLFYSVVYRDL